MKRSRSPVVLSDEHDPQRQHRIPVIDKMMSILDAVDAASSPSSISTIVQRTRLSRSTIYRVLNTLTSHGILARNDDGDYALGFRLVSLAAGVETELSIEDILRLTHPHLVALAKQTSETCKFSVLVDGEAEVVDVVQSPDAIAPSSRVGSRFPLHAGAASKLLLALAPAPVVDAVLSGNREAFTKNTKVDRADLEKELQSIRASGISNDSGEWNVNVAAVAAPLYGINRVLVGAVSITYFSGDHGRGSPDRLIEPLLAATNAMSAALGVRR